MFLRYLLRYFTLVLVSLFHLLEMQEVVVLTKPVALQKPQNTRNEAKLKKVFMPIQGVCQVREVGEKSGNSLIASKSRGI